MSLSRRSLFAVGAGAGLTLATRRVRAQPMRTINFFVVNNMFSTPVYVTAENGYWAQRGIDVKLKITSSGRQVTQALQAGEAQLGHVAFSTTAPAARAAGNMLRGILPYYNDALYVAAPGAAAIIGRKDRGIDPKNPASLVGKTVAILTGSIVEVYFQAWLRKYKVDPSQLKTVSVPIENMPVTLRQGLVDVVVPWEPYTAQVVREMGENAAVVSRHEPGLIANVIGATADENWIPKNYDALFDFVAALAQGAQFVRQSPKESAEILTRYLDGVDIRDAEEGTRYGHWDPRMSVCTAAGVVETGNMMAKDGLIKIAKPFVASDLFDPTVAERVQQKHPEFYSDLQPVPTELAACKGPLNL